MILENLTYVDGPREGSHKFPNGEYRGEWWNKQINGRGVWTDSDGKIYEGFWDSNLAAGLGVITTPDKKQYEAAWFIKGIFLFLFSFLMTCRGSNSSGDQY